MTVTIGDATITEEKHHLMHGFLSKCQKVPEHVIVSEIRDWISFLCVNEAWEEDRVTNEKDRGVVTNQIPDTLFRVELDCESTRITNSISRTTFTTNLGETDRNWSAFANAGEQSSGTKLGDVMRYFEIAESTSALSVNDALCKVLEVLKFSCKVSQKGALVL